ncbi:hypothetical protein [Haliscomenobacter hydrossis]|uniref:Uncharacterized protein n=1 Tax=Haliscomenobacter hydrossis (strain ATCC 27775 / DSM 1100 / LMG 10767 / O) TaxID=760192 RepID=F4L0S1_HALH1|nr:hypothetical protein [Haliscomenobacter hydrossis]AEE49553.1 hypothetical protein Halhy_1664 [Haliscomenobacter hydrossis DSM 1100]
MKISCFFAMLLLACTIASGQDILLDKTVRAGELTLFQSVSNPNDYYYLSDKPKLAVDPATGKPQFSFLRYVENQKGTGDQATKDEGEGGGIIHCVIEMGVTQAQLAAARQDLLRVNSSGNIKGPAIYSGGTFALISTVNDPQSGFARKVLGLGKAPILDGQKAAVSISLTKLGAKVLWESFQTPTPDMSFSFEMDLKGYKSPRRAIIEANFDQIYQHQSFSAAAITRQGNVMLAGEINIAMEDLYKSGAIKVTTYNPDENMEKAVEDAYSKLTRMMFDPAGAGGPPATPALPGQTQTSMLDRAQALLNQGRKDALEDFLLSEDIERVELAREKAAVTTTEANPSTPPPTGNQPTSIHPPGTGPSQTKGYTAPKEKYGYTRPTPTLPTTAIVAAYSMRTVRQRGVFRIDLNKYTIDNLSLRFDQNVGAIDCPDCFKQINLDDPLYKQREVSATVDGYNAEDFQKYINFVSISFRKKHEDGQYTNADLTIDRAKFNQQGNFFPFLYGWKGDNNRLKWREYEYKTVWNFFGGATKESVWAKSDLPTVPLSPPYLRKVIDIEMDQEVVTREGIRSAEVKITYKVEGKDMVKQVRLNPKGGLLTTQIEVLLPVPSINPAPTYDYEITWMLNNGTTKVSPKKSSSNLVIFADQM